MDCRYFDDCSAPICPMDEGRESTTWFPDEPVCRLADVPDWVKRQRKIARKAAQSGYFTVAMLSHGCRIAQGIKGIDPDGTDKERAADEAAWLAKHPAITAEERERLREQGKAYGVHFKPLILARDGRKNTPSGRGLDVLSDKKGIQVPREAGDTLKALKTPQKTPINDVARVSKSKTVESYGKAGEASQIAQNGPFPAPCEEARL